MLGKRARPIVAESAGSPLAVLAGNLGISVILAWKCFESFDKVSKQHTICPRLHGGHSSTCRHASVAGIFDWPNSKLLPRLRIGQVTGLFSLFFRFTSPAGGVALASAPDSGLGLDSLCIFYPSLGRQIRDVTNKDEFPFTFTTYGEHPV